MLEPIPLFAIRTIASMRLSSHALRCECWEQGHQCGSKSNTLCDEEPVYERQNEICTERERERGTKNITIFQKQQLQQRQITTTFTKCYKVTLYSDSLRATALYAIYINSLN